MNNMLNTMISLAAGGIAAYLFMKPELWAGISWRRVAYFTAGSAQTYNEWLTFQWEEEFLFSDYKEGNLDRTYDWVVDFCQSRD
jgi:hypothetical protein